MDLEEFKAAWLQLEQAETYNHVLESTSDLFKTSESIQTRLVHNNVFYVTKQSRETGEVLLFAARGLKNCVFLLELRVSAPQRDVHLTVKASLPQLAQLFIQAINFILTTTF